MKITSQKYQWDDAITAQNANLFSDATAIISPLVLDLMPYLVKGTLSDIETTKENIGTDFNLYLESGNVSFELNNYKPAYEEGHIEDYFGFWQDDFTNSRNKFLIKVYDDDDNEVFRGLLYRDGLKFTNKKRERLSVIVIGLEREFKTYFSNIPFPQVQGAYVGNFGLHGFRYTSFQNVINQLFPRVTLDVEVAIGGFFVAYEAYTYSPAGSFTNGVMHIKTGIDNFRRDNTSSLHWFDSVCLGMGWVWYYHIDKLIIRQRKTVETGNVYTIDYRTSFITHDVAGRLYDMPVDTIFIDDGGYFMPPWINALYQETWNLTGDRKKVYSAKNEYDNNSFSYRHLTISNNPNAYTLLVIDKVTEYMTESNNIFTFSNHYSDTGLVTQQFAPEKFSYQRNQVLELKPYVNTQDNMSGFDFNNARANTGAYYGNGNHYATNYIQTASQLRHTGNCANCLFRYNTTFEKYETYDDYCRGQYNTDFADNFRPLVRSQLQIIFEVELNELLTNPLQSYKLQNYPFFYDIDNRLMKCEKRAFNLETKKSKLTLRLDNAATETLIVTDNIEIESFSITNELETFTFSIDTVNYFYVEDLNIIVVDTDNVKTTIEFFYDLNLDIELNNIIRIFWKQLATIPGITTGTNGIIYYLNCKNIPYVSGHTLSTDEITVNFITGNSKVIKCVNNENATDHNDYLNNIVILNHLTEYLVGKTKHYISPQMSQTQMQAIINGASAGHVVIFSSGVYSNIKLIVKNLVNFIFDDVEWTISASSPLCIFEDTSLSNVKMFARGEANFYNTSILGGWQFVDVNTIGSVIFFSFNKCVSTTPQPVASFPSFFHTDMGKLRVKGLGVRGLSSRLFDGDAGVSGSVVGDYIFDCDILYAITDAGDTHFIPWSQRMKFYLRNNYLEMNRGIQPVASSNLFGMQQLNESPPFTEISVINSRLKNNNPVGGIILVDGTPFENNSTGRFWRSSFKKAAAGDGFGGLSIINYTKNYSNVETTVTQTGSGQLIIDELLAFDRPIE